MQRLSFEQIKIKTNKNHKNQNKFCKFRKKDKKCNICNINVFKSRLDCWLGSEENKKKLG
ncbi:hypothetical protein BpHYR1_007648 [Brachionus plicatilis]|uniref:Uncharacterized protein n=1 Tax=Brachionus plicatilis TaxID=10195 RepID=A0A3M7RY10_BRAPC|nr:hypothetical protein BpHYR1_007648 [Brachionus plicatilis]